MSSKTTPQQRPVQHKPYLRTPMQDPSKPATSPPTLNSNHGGIGTPPQNPADRTTTTPSGSTTGLMAAAYSAVAAAGSGGPQGTGQSASAGRPSQGESPPFGFVTSMYVATPQQGPGTAGRMSPAPSLGPNALAANASPPAAPANSFANPPGHTPPSPGLSGLPTHSQQQYSQQQQQQQIPAQHSAPSAQFPPQPNAPAGYAQGTNSHPAPRASDATGEGRLFGGGSSVFGTSAGFEGWGYNGANNGGNTTQHHHHHHQYQQQQQQPQSVFSQNASANGNGAGNSPADGAGLFGGWFGGLPNSTNPTTGPQGHQHHHHHHQQQQQQQQQQPGAYPQGAFAGGQGAGAGYAQPSNRSALQPERPPQQFHPYPNNNNNNNTSTGGLSGGFGSGTSMTRYGGNNPASQQQQPQQSQQQPRAFGTNGMRTGAPEFVPRSLGGTGVALPAAGASGGGGSGGAAHTFLNGKLRYINLPLEDFAPPAPSLSQRNGPAPPQQQLDPERPINMFTGRGRPMQEVCPSADLFVAQLPFNMHLSALQYLFDNVASVTCDIMHAAPHYKRGRSYDGCAFVKVSMTVAQILIETFHKAALFDQAGVWVADTPEQRRILGEYCSFMQEKTPQERRVMLQKPIPFSAMTVELANRSYSF